MAMGSRVLTLLPCRRWRQEIQTNSNKELSVDSTLHFLVGWMFLDVGSIPCRHLREEHGDEATLETVSLLLDPRTHNYPRVAIVR